jgi:H+-transporting ATPase
MGELKGLSTDKANELLKKYGFNEIVEKKENPLIDFLKRFTGLTAYVIEASLIISLLLKRYIDSGVMFALLLLNAVLGFTQEFRASKAIESLKKRLSIRVRVLRDGVWKELSSKEVVPNDIIKTSMGDIVPADAEILEGSLLVDQSVLTGESLAQERASMIKFFQGALSQEEMQFVLLQQQEVKPILEKQLNL